MVHSVTLDNNKCKGCTTCIKQCPTEAIRVRRGKAIIIAERCIDCGECIRICPHHAKKCVCDPWESLRNFKYTVALPAPSLYGQFYNLDNISIILQGLLLIGFDAVYEVARAAEVITQAARGDKLAKLPVISSACPACTRLICQRFPKLISHISPHIAPVELAAVRARQDAVKKTGLKPEEIGVFFISPCPAKVTAAHRPVTLDAPVMDGALSMTEVYVKLLPAMKKVVENDTPDLMSAGFTGVGWATCGGESGALKNERYMAVDGIKNVITVLEDIDDGKYPEFEFIELAACMQGCLGGCLTVENPFAAKNRVRLLMEKLPELCTHEEWAEDDELAARRPVLEHTPVWLLDSDMREAIRKQKQIHELVKKLPGLDCSSCGAPSCQAFAEDTVLGFAQEEDCIFHMREFMDKDDYLPPPFRNPPKDDAGDRRAVPAESR